MGDAGELVRALAETTSLLASLGRAADVPIVPPAFATLSELARDEGAAFFPSGAGGGDVGVFASTTPPSAAFLERAQQLGMIEVSLTIDPHGVRFDEEWS
jgi:hypothetical protein